MSLMTAMPELIRDGRRTPAEQRALFVARGLTVKFLPEYSPRVKADMFKFISTVLFAAERETEGRAHVDIASLNLTDSHEAELDQAAQHLLGKVSEATSPLPADPYLTSLRHEMNETEGLFGNGIVTTYPLVIHDRILEVLRHQPLASSVPGDTIGYRIEL